MSTTLRSTDILFNDGSTQSTSAINMAAGASVGAVGTYAFLQNNSGANILPGGTVAGSSTYYSNAYGANWYCYSGTSPAGTWRCVGYARRDGNPDRQSVFLRIS